MAEGIATVVFETQFIKQFVSYVFSFRKEVNLMLSEEGISVSTENYSNIAMVCVDLKFKGAVHHLWNSPENFTVGISMDAWKKALEAAKSSCPHTMIEFISNKDTTVLSMGMWDHYAKKLDFIKRAEIRNVDLLAPTITSNDLDIILSASFDSKILRQDIAQYNKSKPYSIDIELCTEEKEITIEPTSTEDDMLKLLGKKKRSVPVPPPPPPVTRKIAVAKSVRISCSSEGSKFETCYEAQSIHRDSPPIGGSATPAWKTGASIEVEPRTDDEAAKISNSTIVGLDDLDMVGDEAEERATFAVPITPPPPKKQKVDKAHASTPLNRKTLGYICYMYHIADILTTPGASSVVCQYPPGPLSNLTAGAVFSNRVKLDIVTPDIKKDPRKEGTMLRLTYDLEARGTIVCYLASKVTE